MAGKTWEGSPFAAWMQRSWRRSLTSSPLFRPPSLQAQSWPLPQVEWLLSAAVPGCGGRLEAGADTEGRSRHPVCPGVRGENQGGRGDQQAARQRSGSQLRSEGQQANCSYKIWNTAGKEVADPCRNTII